MDGLFALVENGNLPCRTLSLLESSAANLAIPFGAKTCSEDVQDGLRGGIEHEPVVLLASILYVRTSSPTKPAPATSSDSNAKYPIETEDIGPLPIPSRLSYFQPTLLKEQCFSLSIVHAAASTGKTSLILLLGWKLKIPITQYDELL